MINPTEGNLPKQACIIYREYRIFNNISRTLSVTVQLQYHYHSSTRTRCTSQENIFRSSELQEAPEAPGAAGTSEILPVGCGGAAAPQAALPGAPSRQQGWLPAPPPARCPHLHTAPGSGDQGVSRATCTLPWAAGSQRVSRVTRTLPWAAGTKECPGLFGWRAVLNGYQIAAFHTATARLHFPNSLITCLYLGSQFARGIPFLCEIQVPLVKI